MTTVLEGLRELCPETDFVFVDQSWDPRNMSESKVEEAADAARKCDLNIVVAGEYMFRGRWTERTSGEDTDRSDIDLVGLQNELIEKVSASGKPTVLVLVSGRPLGVQWAAGQVQMIYNHKPSQYFHPYAVTPSTPLYPFGYGLSYTEYEYSDLRTDTDTIATDGTVKVSVNVRNAGKMAGDEVVQLYIRDRYSQVTRPVKELKDFARVHLEPGEIRTVEFTVTPDKLSFLDKKLRPIVEPGEFILMVGPSSADSDLLKTSFWVK